MLETMLSSFENNLEGTNITPPRGVSDKIACLFPSQFSEVYSPSNTHAINSHQLLSCPNHSGEYSDLTDVRVTCICGMLRIG